MRLPEAAPRRAPVLLVSVRSGREAIAALEGGASIIDLKEPSRGALGRVAPRAEREVVDAILEHRGTRAPMLTAALGELIEMDPRADLPLSPRISIAKIGLSGTRGSDWRTGLDSWMERLGARAGGPSLVAVAYADAGLARSPGPGDVLAHALARRLPYLLIDTWDKRAGRLLDHLSPERLGEWIGDARKGGVRVALAGSLREEDLPSILPLEPDVIAVRGAVCGAGVREGEVERDRVASLAGRLRQPS